MSTVLESSLAIAPTENITVPITLDSLFEKLKQKGTIDLGAFRDDTSKITDWSEYKVEDLRGKTKIIKALCKDMEKSELSPYHSLMTAMMVEERSRPIDEQFPLLRSDMDDLTSNVRSLSDTSKTLCRTEENRGKEMLASR
jgi:hypothetical protein